MRPLSMLAQSVLLFRWMRHAKRVWNKNCPAILESQSPEMKAIILKKIHDRPYLVLSCSTVAMYNYICTGRKKVPDIYMLRAISQIVAWAILDDAIIDNASSQLSRGELTEMLNNRSDTAVVQICPVEVQAAFYLLNWCESTIMSSTYKNRLERETIEMLQLVYVDDTTKVDAMVRIEMGALWGNLFHTIMEYDDRYSMLFRTLFGGFALLDDLADVAIDYGFKDTYVLQYIREAGFARPTLLSVIRSGAIGEVFRVTFCYYKSIDGNYSKVVLIRYFSFCRIISLGYCVKMVGKFVRKRLLPNKKDPNLILVANHQNPSLL